MVVLHYASTTYELVHLEALPHLAALPTHYLKTQGTVPRLVCLVKYKIQLSGHLRYRPAYQCAAFLVLNPNRSLLW